MRIHIFGTVSKGTAQRQKKKKHEQLRLSSSIAGCVGVSSSTAEALHPSDRGMQISFPGPQAKEHPYYL